MNSSGEELHSNWRALSTVCLPLKRFVREGFESSAEEKRKRKYDVNGVSGAEASHFYKEILNSPSTTSSTLCAVYKEERTLIESSRQSFDKNKFFRFAMTNNVTELENMIIKDDDINVSDEFGWTALMMAACEGAIASVKWLCDFGADRNAKDRAGNTALTLARKNGFHSIISLLKMASTTTKSKADCIPTEAIMEPFYCEVCQSSYKETSIRAHQTSTVHRFNEKSKTPLNKLNKFNISVKNRGLQLMVKQGWDREHGLGPTKNGRLYPVKTTLRKDRTGIGTKQPVARVTHFAAFDIRATQRRNAPMVFKLTRNEMKREKLRNWKRDRQLRSELQ